MIDAVLSAPPLFSDVAELDQISTARAFLRSIACLAGPLASQVEFAARATTLPEQHWPDAATWVRYALAVADYCVLDEMRPDYTNLAWLRQRYAWADRASIYYRFFAYESFIPQPVFERIWAATGLLPKHVIVAVPEQIRRRFDGQGQVGRLTGDLNYWADSGHKDIPPAGVPRQQLFAALLRCGINPLSQHGDPVERVVRDKSSPRFLRKYRRLVPLATRLNQEAVESLGEKSRAHWRGLLREGSLESATVLFNSGAAANEAVIAALGELAAGPAYTHPYWYFENKLSIGKAFADRQTSRPAESRVMFLNLEPATIHSRLADGEAAPPVELAVQFASRAANEPSHPFWLVIDVTMNPLLSMRELIRPWPINLNLVKTVSATKHQYGGRNYCFGVAGLFGNETERLAVRARELTPMFGGELMEAHALHFPRPTAAFLRQTRASLAAKNQSLTALVPAGSAWKIMPHSYVAFLAPPEAPMLEIAEFLRERKKYYGREEFAKRYAFLRDLGKLLVGSLLGKDHLARFPDIETGNSFGLPVTRVLYDQSSTIVDGNILGMATVRIAPGYETDPAQLFTFVPEMIDRFARAMRKVAPLLGCRDGLDLIYPNRGAVEPSQ